MVTMSNTVIDPEVRIDTSCGTVLGCQTPNGRAFYGVPYAKADRWRYPNVIRNWPKPVVATAQPPVCFQPESPDLEKATFSEDCLFLNIFCPAYCKDAPVMLFLHGGNFVYGGLTCRNTQLGQIAEKGIVAISAAYRLGALGFAALPDLSGAESRSGNYGIYDLQAALIWVYENIRFFGGDSRRITVFGHSAGAIAGEYLCSSELTEGMIQQAVLLSGGPKKSRNVRWVNVEKTYPMWEKVRQRCHAVDCSAWRKTDPAQIVQAFQQQRHASFPGADVAWFHPSADGYLIRETRDSNAYRRNKRIRYMIGCTQNDMDPEQFKHSLQEWREDVPDVYTCIFEHPCRGVPNSAVHDSDIPYWLGTLNLSETNENDRLLSERMIMLLTGFIKDGKPSCPGTKDWSKGEDYHIL